VARSIYERREWIYIVGGRRKEKQGEERMYKHRPNQKADLMGENRQDEGTVI